MVEDFRENLMLCHWMLLLMIRITAALACLLAASGAADASLRNELRCVIDTSVMCASGRCDSSPKATQITIDVERKMIRECFTDADGLICVDKVIGFQSVSGTLNEWLVFWINEAAPMETFAINMKSGVFTSSVGSVSARLQVFQSGLCDLRNN